ncbi:MAG: GFA family protein [Patescibacteria group bacterium]
MTKYTGGCHCGAVKYEVETDLSEVMDCNCSHCAKKGFLLAFVPADQFQLLSGEESLTEYRFNKKAIAHLFCSVCGVQSFGRGSGPDGKEVVALNARCLDGIDMSTLTIKHVDGKSW